MIILESISISFTSVFETVEMCCPLRHRIIKSRWNWSFSLPYISTYPFSVFIPQLVYILSVGTRLSISCQHFLCKYIMYVFCYKRIVFTYLVCGADSWRVCPHLYTFQNISKNYLGCCYNSVNQKGVAYYHYKIPLTITEEKKRSSFVFLENEDLSVISCYTIRLMSFHNPVCPLALRILTISDWYIL